MIIKSLDNTRGLRYAALVNASNTIEEQTGSESPDLLVTSAAKALVGSLKSSVGSEDWKDLLLDIDGGPVLLTPVGESILVAAFDEVASLGRIRFAVRRAISKA